MISPVRYLFSGRSRNVKWNKRSGNLMHDKTNFLDAALFTSFHRRNLSIKTHGKGGILFRENYICILAHQGTIL